MNLNVGIFRKKTTTKIMELLAFLWDFNPYSTLSSSNITFRSMFYRRTFYDLKLI